MHGPGQPPGDRVSMAPAGKSASAFQCVSEGMPEVQMCADSLFERVLLYYRSFYVEGGGDDSGQNIFLSPENRRKGLFQFPESGVSRQHCMLYKLGKTAHHFTVRKGFQKTGINYDKGSGMKRSYYILIPAMIDTGFPAEGGIHHAQKSRRNQDDLHSPHVYRGGKGCHIADDPTAQGAETRIPSRSCIQGKVDHP